MFEHVSVYMDTFELFRSNDETVIIKEKTYDEYVIQTVEVGIEKESLLIYKKDELVYKYHFIMEKWEVAINSGSDLDELYQFVHYAYYPAIAEVVTALEQSARAEETFFLGIESLVFRKGKRVVAFDDSQESVVLKDRIGYVIFEKNPFSNEWESTYGSHPNADELIQKSIQKLN